MELVSGLAFVGILVVLTLVLPVLSFYRARRAITIAEGLRARLDSLERKVDALAAGRSHPAVDAELPVDGTRSRPVAVVPEPHPVAEAPPPRTPAPPRPTPVASSPDLAAATGADFEQMIGGRWLLYVGVAALVLGMSYFVKFAFDNGWISEPLRVMAGGFAGLVLIGAGVRFWSRGLALFGQALAGGGMVVLYVSIYAALHFYALLTPTPAFGLMAIVTAGAAYLADRQRSQPLAVLALLGGFATPLLVGGRQDSQVVLFTYIAILISGAALLARRHAWPLLSAGSYVCTCALVIAWFFSSYTTGQWLRTELFLTLFVTLFGYLLWTLLVTRSGALQAQLSVAALMTAPLAYHLASLILLNPHPAAWLVYLVAFTVAGLVIAQRSRTPWVRVAVLLLAGLPNLAWLQALPDRGWYAAAVVSVFMLYGLHLAAQWESTSDDAAQGEIPLLEVVHTQLNGLWLPVSLYVFLDTRYAWLDPWMVAALSAWNGALAGVARRIAPRTTLQFVALSATLAAVALVLAFDGPAVAVGWAAEGVVLGWLAVRERSRRIGIGSGLLIGLGSTQLVLLLAAPPVASDVPIFNSRTLAAALIVALLAWLAWRIRDDPEVTVRGQARTAVIIAANLLCLALVSAEIHAFFRGRGADSAIAGAPTSAAAADLAEQVTLSVVWAMYAVALIAAGIRRRYAPARYLAIALFGVTVVKVLLNDIAGLDRLHRMLSVLGVGVLLVLASYLYQRMAADTTVSR